MMRLHRLSSNILPPLSNAKKSSIQKSCKDDESNIEKYPHFDPETAPISNSDDRHAPSILANSLPSTSPDIGLSIGCELPQWGHNRRSRGSRTENRSSSPAMASGCGLSVQSRRHVVKVHRRSATILAAERVATASVAMPPPMALASYTINVNMKPTLAGQDPRTVEDRSDGSHRVDKLSSPSPARKSYKSPSNVDCVVNQESKQPSDHDTGGSGTETVAAVTTTISRINFDRLQLPRIFLTLSRKEKEDDFLAMRGTKLPQRPKKRAKNVDKNMQYCFPGMWLADLTRSRYEVREKKCAKKRRRGLKGMESMDSDSE